MKQIFISAFLLIGLLANGQEVKLGLPLGSTERVESAQFCPDGRYILITYYDGTFEIRETISGKLLNSAKLGLSVNATAQFSPDWKYIITNTPGDSTAKIWDLNTLKLINELAGHKKRIESAQFSPAGNYIIIAYWNGVVEIWDAVTCKIINNGIETWKGRSPEFSYDDKYLFTLNDTIINMWDIQSGKLFHILQGNSGQIQSFHIAPDGKTLSSFYNSGRIKIWDTRNGNLIRTFDSKTGPEDYSEAKVSSDGNYIVRVKADGMTRIWDARNGNLISTFNCMPVSPDFYFSDATVSPDGKYVAIALGGTIKICEITSGKILFSIEAQKDESGGNYYNYIHYSNDGKNIQFSNDGENILTASGDSSKIWQTLTGKLLRKLKGHSAKFSPDEKYIITYSDVTSVWENSSGKLLYNIGGHIKKFYSAQYSPDGKSFVTASGDRTAKIWDSSTGKLIHTLQGHTAPVFWARYSTDGKYIVTTSGDSTAKIWDVSNGELLFNLVGHRSSVSYAQFSPDGKYIVTASDDKTAKKWDTSNGKLMFSMEGHRNRINSAQFSPDGKYIVTASADMTARIWDGESGKLLHYLVSHVDEVSSLMFSADGKYIMTSSPDNYVKIWETTSGKLVHDFEGNPNTVNRRSADSDQEYYTGFLSALYSNDGKYYVTASYDNTAGIWESSSGRLLFKLKGDKTWVTSALFSPDGKYVLTTSYDGDLKIWESSSGKLLYNLRGHSGFIPSAQFSPDGKYILTASYDGSFIIWETQTGKKLVQEFVIDEKELVTIGENNFFEATPGALKQMYFVKGLEVLPLESNYDKFFRPKLWERLMKGEKIE